MGHAPLTGAAREVNGDFRGCFWNFFGGFVRPAMLDHCSQIKVTEKSMKSERGAVVGAGNPTPPSSASVSAGLG